MFFSKLAKRMTRASIGPSTGFASIFWIGRARCVSGNSPPFRKQTLAESQPALAFTREQFLRDRVAVVVRQHVRLLDAMLLQQRLAEIGLQADRHTWRCAAWTRARSQANRAYTTSNARRGAGQSRCQS